MNINLPPVLLRHKDARVLIDAIYFIVRVLRNVNRGYQQTAISTESTEDAYRLANRAIHEIEAYEKTEITNLDRDRIGEYIRSLEELQRKTYLHDVGNVPSKEAAKILGQMRRGGEK